MLADQGAMLSRLLASSTLPPSASVSFTSPASKTTAMAASGVNEMPKPLELRCKQIIRKEIMKNWLVQTLGQNKGSKRKAGESNYGTGEGQLAFDYWFKQWTANRAYGLDWGSLSTSHVQSGGVSQLTFFVQIHSRD